MNANQWRAVLWSMITGALLMAATPASATCLPDPKPISCGADITGCSLSRAGETDRFTFKAPVGGAVAIKVAPGADVKYTDRPTFRWDITDPHGKPVSPFSCSSSGLPCDTTAFKEGGTYTILVSNSVNLTGHYSFSMQGISQKYNCSSRIADAQTLQGSFSHGADLDAYGFNSQAGAVYSINVAAQFYWWWTLYDPNGAIVTRCPSVPGGCKTPPLRAGLYTILLYNSANKTGSYTITLQKVSG